MTILRGLEVFFVSENKVGLHCRTERIYVAVGMFTRQNVLALREWVKIIVLDEPDCEIAIARISAALVGEEEIFRESVGFIPSEGDFFMRTGTLCGAAQRLLGQMVHSGRGGAPMNIECVRTGGEFMGVN